MAIKYRLVALNAVTLQGPRVGEVWVQTIVIFYCDTVPGCVYTVGVSAVL